MSNITVKQGCMPPSIYYLEYGRHVTPTSNTTSHANHEKINSWVSFSLLYEHGAPLGGPSGRRSAVVLSERMARPNGKAKLERTRFSPLSQAECSMVKTLVWMCKS